MDNHIQNFRSKPGKWGRKNFYWEPSPSMRAEGWQTVALGHDYIKAIGAAVERNAALQKWKDHGGGPAGIRARPPVYTLAWLIERYRRDVIEGKKPDGTPCLAEATIGQYKPALARLAAWAGDKPLDWVMKGRVTELKKTLLVPDAEGKVGHHVAYATLKMGRTLFAYAISVDIIERANPFDKFKLGAPAPRAVIWSPPAREAVPAAARALGHASIALAIELGFASAQRPADLRALPISRFVEIKPHEVRADLYADLAGRAPDGVPRGILVKQRKTGTWVKVPVIDEVRAAVEANIARAKAAGATTILIDDTRLGGPSDPTYCDTAGKTRFDRDFAESRAFAAATARDQGDAQLADEIAGLEFRDLRRTCVVYFGELGLNAELIAGVTGHSIDETTEILKTYMPQTTGRAAEAIMLAAAREARDAARQKAPGSP